MLWNSLHEVVGPTGTVLVPTYTFSFCRQETFDIEKSSTVWGEWNTFFEFPEYFRRLPGAIGQPIQSFRQLESAPGLQNF